MIRFITFEGGDGTGKTTQIQALERYLAARGKSFVSTREPGGTALGKHIRELLLEIDRHPIAAPTELFLYLADRAHHVKEVIIPALHDGKIVLCDRYSDSTLAYQGYGRGLDLEMLRRFNQLADHGVKPDLTLLFDCPVRLSLSRTVQRVAANSSNSGREDRLERERAEFHEKVRAGFLALARAEPDRFRIIDASQPATTTSSVIEEIMDRNLG
jgi:dTMP kinase